MNTNSKEKDVKDEIIEAIEKVSEILGKPLTNSEIEIEDLVCPHTPPGKLPDDRAAVYSFIYNGEFLKIGKANKKSQARYTSQHYSCKAAQSTLAKSICEDTQMQIHGVNADNVKEWIMQNTRRINILVKCKNSEWATGLIEAIMHYKYMPRYEGRNTVLESGEVKFDVDKIVNYLEKYDLKEFWNTEKRKAGIKEKKINSIPVLSNDEKEKLAGLTLFEMEIQLKKIIKEKLDNENKDSETYKELCLWIIKDWGGIRGSKDDVLTMDLIDDFLSVENDEYEFNRIASTSKIASFKRPSENVIYDSRVTFSLNWIIFSQNAGNIFFPIPLYQSPKRKKAGLEELIRGKYINEIEAYSELNKLIKSISKKLWADCTERIENLYYTEMLLFAIANKEMCKEISEYKKKMKSDDQT